MLLSHTRKFIFIHNYKVAGSSISNALSKYTEDVRRPNALERTGIALNILPRHYPAKYPWHITAGQLRERLKGTGVFESYFKFGLVRNPWDWQVSLYTFMLKTPGHAQHKLVKGMKDFDEYIDWRVNNDLHLQREAFYDEAGNCLMDFIGKIENIDHDFQHFCQRVGIEETVPHINKSRDNNNYLQFYTPRSVSTIYQAYREDIVTFGYDKPVMEEVVAMV